MNFLTSPITLIILAFLALVVAGVLLYKNWDKVKAKAIEIWNKISSYFDTTLEDIKTAFSNAFESIKSVVLGVFESIMDGIKSVINWVIDKINLLIRTANTLTAALPGTDGLNIKEFSRIEVNHSTDQATNSKVQAFTNAINLSLNVNTHVDPQGNSNTKFWWHKIARWQ